MNRSTRLTPIALTLAVLFTCEAVQGQVLVNCCMADGSCQSFFGGCPSGSVQTDLFCSNCGCAGNCGGQAANCWCDGACHGLGDCCNDVCQHCTGPQVPNCSCQGGCPVGPIGQCWCDPNCWVFNDCCLDICDHCTAHYPDQCTTCVGNTCASAQRVGDGPTDNNGISGCAPSGTSDSCSIAGKDRWFAYTATCNGIASASVCITDELPLTFDVALSVFDACPAQQGIELACGNDHPNLFCNESSSAHVTWPVLAGETYLVRLSGEGTFATVEFACNKAPGACCFGTTCEQLTANACTAAGGQWLGAEVDCDFCVTCDSWNWIVHPTMSFTCGGGFSGALALSNHDADLIVGGDFTTFDGELYNRIARLHAPGQHPGVEWLPFVSPNGDVGIDGISCAATRIEAMLERGNDLIVGGAFTSGGGETLNMIARWDGASGGWHPLGSGMTHSSCSGCAVLALVEYKGEVIAGGQFTEADGQDAPGIARWDGSQWHPLPGLSGTVRSLAVYDGALVAGGSLQIDGAQGFYQVARWNDSPENLGWEPLATGNGAVYALAEYNGDLIAAGRFTTFEGAAINRIARWDGSIWHPLGTGMTCPPFNPNCVVHALAEYNGTLVAAGEFASAGGIVADRVARWNGFGWQSMPGIYVGGNPSWIFALHVHGSDLIAGGAFALAATEPLTIIQVARWRDCSPPNMCGDPDAGDCFVANGSPSCDDGDCCAAVCEQDSYCCSIDWDGVCVMQAEALCTGPPAGECGSPLSGDCFAVSNTPACKNEACCEAVCKIDGFCCKTAWDQGCVTLAQDICNQPGFSNSGGQAGQFTGQGPHGLFKYQVEYFNGSLASGSLCCGLDTLPQTVFADFVLDIYEGIGTTPGYTAGLENVVSFSLQFGENHWTDLLLFDITFDAIGPTMASDLTWMGARIETDNGWDVPLNFPLTFKGENAAGEPFEILYTDSICELIPTNCNEIGCCEGHCDGVSPVGCACDAGCSDRGDCCSDACATCEFTECCPADLTGTGSVEVFDLLALLGVWGPCPAPPEPCPADLDGNGDVNVFDLLDLLGQWGPCP